MKTAARKKSKLPPGETLAGLFATVQQRKRTKPRHSYVAALIRAGRDAIACKLAEETGEVIKAVREQDRTRKVREFCDLFFHAFVLMAHQNLTFDHLEAELSRRHGISGLEEKARRKTKRKAKRKTKRKTK
jgi:phosphoribosyl-ATP pyrophosphohydrolase